MPRQAQVKVDNSFVGGLITENSPLNFPDNAATETWNCVFDETGRVSRRLGFDVEKAYNTNSVTISTDGVFTEFVWHAVAGVGTTSFLVQQQGSTLHFWDVSTGSSDISSNKKSFTVNLTTYLATDSPRSVKDYPCQFASGNGDLLVVSQAIEPLSVEYSSATDSLTVSEILVQHRDFTGVEDGIALLTRTTSTVTDLKINNPEKYYNILNQSWHAGDALSQWDTARTDIPSDADYVGLYRSSSTDAFDNSIVSSISPGNRPAPKGHFILTAWDPDRTQAMVDEGFTGATLGTDSAAISYSNGTVIGNFTSNPSYAFDNSNDVSTGSTARIATTSSGWIGKSFTTPFRIAKVDCYGSNDVGYVSGVNPSVTITLYGKQGTAPTGQTDGTSLGSVTFTDGATGDEGPSPGNGPRIAASSDQATFYDHSWIEISHNDGGLRNVNVGEITFYAITGDATETYTIERPRCVDFFAGRAWYGGIEVAGLSNNIYFSQIITTSEQFGKCYQTNDPTTEEFTDLLPDDGGVIRIPEMGKLIRLHSYQSGLLVFATNGVWLISGSANASFLATDYVVKRLSNEGTSSSLSFLSQKGIPAWWGDKGINTIKYDPNYGSFDIVSLTDNKISSFITDIPTYNRGFVKGMYDIENDTGYWLFNDSETLEDDGEEYIYTKALVVNGLTGAFYPWTIGEATPKIRGISYVQDPSLTETGRIKFLTTVDIDASNQYLTFSEVKNETYKDWSRYGALVLSNSEEVDYTSYFITGYRIAGQAMRFFQPNYMFFFFDYEENGAARAQSIFDFTTSGNSGKWSRLQSVYDCTLCDRSVSYARRKFRGKGRAMQTKVTSVSGKPFTLVGWTHFGSINSGI